MSRPMLVTRTALRAAWSKTRPDVNKLASMLGVSVRSAYRYLDSISTRERKCPHCNGKGFIWK